MEVDLLHSKLVNYSEQDAKQILKAFDFACNYHQGQYRQSGEAYIIHPLNVALILMNFNADCDTVCAGLLHDVLEDTKASEKELLENFNEDVLKLVKGVTNLVTPELTKSEARVSNIRKVISSITDDVRIIIVKLADRLHNMRTLEYKNPENQKRKAVETLEIYAPLAGCLGAYNIRSELEDLSLRYLRPDEYLEIKEKCFEIKELYQKSIDEMIFQIRERLNKNHIKHDTRMKIRNIYGIYRNLKGGKTYDQMHDLVAIETLVNNYKACYQTLGIIHQLYPCLESGFKDYISKPKPNMYQSIHTTVFGPKDFLIQNQIRTFEMDKIAQNGILSYWDNNQQNAHVKMQDDLHKKFQFYKSLMQLNGIYTDDIEFVAQAQFELLAQKVYVYTSEGVIIELPYGATVIDAAYHISDEIGDHIIRAIVNDKVVDMNYVMKNKDRLSIITGPNINSHIEWEKYAQTTYAKQRIKELNS